MRRVWAVGLALLTLGVASACTGDGPSRPEPAAGKAMRIVGGGSGHVPTGTGKVSATEVDGSHLAAMAVTGEGTVYVLHADGTIYRADTDGRLSRVGGDQSTAVNETGGMALTSEGDLVVVGGASDEFVRVSVADGTLERMPLEGLPDTGHATAVAIAADDDATYVADADTGVVYARDADGTLEPLPRFDPDGCDAPRFVPQPTGVAVIDDDVFVADQGCDVLYRVDGDDAEFVAGVQSFDTNATTGPACPDVADTGFFATTVAADGGALLVAIESCRTVFRVSTDGSDIEALNRDSTFEGDGAVINPITAVGRDDHGHVYLLDADGVVMITTTSGD